MEEWTYTCTPNTWTSLCSLIFNPCITPQLANTIQLNSSVISGFNVVLDSERLWCWHITWLQWFISQMMWGSFRRCSLNITLPILVDLKRKEINQVKCTHPKYWNLYILLTRWANIWTDSNMPPPIADHFTPMWTPLKCLYHNAPGHFIHKTSLSI